MLEAYIRSRLIDAAEYGVDWAGHAARREVQTDLAHILAPLLGKLDDDTLRHLLDAGWESDAYTATVPLWDSFQVKVAGASIEKGA